jgi:hypothetical protein
MSCSTCRWSSRWTYAKLGIPLREQEMLAGVEHEDGTRSRVAIDAVFDSVSVATTFQEELAKVGVLFMPISEALQKQPELVKKYLGTVVPISDNFFATLNSAVFPTARLSACRKASGLRACWQLTAAADDLRGDDTSRLGLFRRLRSSGRTRLAQTAFGPVSAKFHTPLCSIFH